MKSNKIILIPLFFFIFSYIFLVLNSGGVIKQLGQLIQPALFAASCIICIFFPKKRKNIIYTALTLLVLMVLTYLFNFLETSNWTGSLGFGLLLITVFSYIPELIKEGFIKKF